jgi:hypothetical protein
MRINAIYLLVASLLTSLPTCAAGIDSFTFASGVAYYYQPFSLNYLYLGINPQVYSADDGSSWNAGAGSTANYGLQMTNINVIGSTVRYTLTPVTPFLFPGLVMFGSADSGSHSTNGIFSAGGPLILQATIGSNEALLSGFLSLDSNVNDGRPGFEYFDSPVGALVPFTDTFRLQSGAWDANTFSTNFSYATSGQVNFVPEPTTASMVLCAALLTTILCNRTKLNPFKTFHRLR